MRDDTVGVPAAVSVMSVVQSERPFRLAVDIRGCFTISPAGCVFFFRGTHNVRDELQLSHFVG